MSRMGSDDYRFLTPSLDLTLLQLPSFFFPVYALL